ncbi:MAG: hypothetical protein OWU84_05230 [Firmicutes bacterium]|nr:hypothetical protein [Bacillota bacterium]
MLDIGASCGEWLAAQRDVGIPAVGTELNAMRAERLAVQRFLVDVDDALDYLRWQEAGAFSAVTVFLGVEHWRGLHVGEAVNLPS